MLEFSDASIIVTSSSRTLIRLLSRMVKCNIFSGRVSVIVWDHPNYLLLQNTNAYNFINKLDFKAFNEIVKSNAYFYHMGERMRVALGISESNSEIMRYFVPMHPVKRQIQNGNVINIVMIGSIYAKDCWNSFVNMLIQNQWKVRDKIINLHYFGSYPSTGVVSSPRIIIHPSIEPELLNIALASFHFGYVPYSFKNDFSIVAETSFPGKASTFSAMQLPLIYHGPIDTEICDAVTRCKSGVVLSNINALDMYSNIEAAIDSYDKLCLGINEFWRSEVSMSRT